MTSNDVLKAHFFQVVKPDGTLGRVTIHAKRDGTVARITEGHLLKDLIGEAPGKAEKTAGQKISTIKSKRDISFFDEKIPCWFEGCEELREDYANKKEKIQGSDSPCVSCELSTLMRQYLALLAGIDTEG